jgi:hypothetical protein
MVSEKSEVRGGTSPVKTDLEDRKQLARKALSEIELIGPAAVIEIVVNVPAELLRS